MKARANRAPPVGHKKVVDNDYNAIKDYCPPFSTVENPKQVYASWGATQGPLDLTNDPDRHMLPDQEAFHVAAPLRLTCAQYLTQKRRIFRARLWKIQHPNPKDNSIEFNKTDAQGATKIDVNKASQLFLTYERLGWFKPHLFEKWLDEEIEGYSK